MNRYEIGDSVRWVGNVGQVPEAEQAVGIVVGIEYDMPPVGSGRVLDPATAGPDDPDWQYVGYRVRFEDGEEASYVDGQIQPEKS